VPRSTQTVSVAGGKENDRSNSIKGSPPLFAYWRFNSTKAAEWSDACSMDAVICG
jgi:hypothetical protein